jgi:hypothetical protein
MTKQTFSTAVKPSPFVMAQLENADYRERYAQCVERAKTWALSRLQKFYASEYNSIRSRKQQAKSRHIAFDDRLKDFRDWLIHLGPRPAAGWTVHRIHHYKGYQPGNLKWATKEEQTAIRKVTKWHKVNGKHVTTKQFACLLGISYMCLYKRLRNGWTIARLLETTKKESDINAWTFPSEVAHVLAPLYAQRKHPNQSRVDWYISYLARLIKLSAASIPDDQILRLDNLLSNAIAERDAILEAQRKQHAQEVQSLLVALSPATASDSH